MFTFSTKESYQRARIGEFTTPHGVIQTPVFMPVGTKATVKGITTEDLKQMGSQIILNNTYHLYLRPGTDVIKNFGGLHNFQKYFGPILTDSGGFQVFSLGEGKRNTNSGESLVKVTEDGVHFRSIIDGSKHFFSPEAVMDIECSLGADIIMAFDECSHGNSTQEYAKKAMTRTHNWLERCLNRWKENERSRKEQGVHPQALFGIVQGVVYDELRKVSAQFVSSLDTPGVAIGGLSVGESKEDMYRTLDVVEPFLPKNKPRYLMGVGTPEDLVEGIFRGIDMFDCVLPTRIGRHGKSFGTFGDKNLKNEKYKLSDLSLDEECPCTVCKTYSVGYIRHLIIENEMLGMKLLSYHNLAFLIHITNLAKNAIISKNYEKFREEFYLKKLYQK